MGTSWIWEVSARAVGMGFAYGLGGLGEFEIRIFRISLFFFVFFLISKGGAEIGVTPKGTEHLIRL